MGTLSNVQSWQVKVLSGVWPAAMSIMHNGSEISLVQGQVIVSDNPGGNEGPNPVWIKPVIGMGGGPESTQFTPINAQIGPMLARRSYDGALPASWASSAAASDVAAGRHSYWSWKPDLLAFPTNNSMKTAFSNFLDTIPDGHQATIVAWHEPENDIGNGDWTVNQWGALQDAAGTVVRSKGRPELRFGICFMGPWTFDTRSPYFNYDWDNALDWDLIDVIGIDPYRTTAGSTVSLQTMLTVRNSGSGGGSAPSMLTRLQTWNKPVAIMEWGCYNSSEASASTFITDAYAWMCSWNQAHTTPESGWIESALWFNYTLTGSDNPLTGIEVDAYAAIIADSKIAPV